jgi:hypothetical protein
MPRRKKNDGAVDPTLPEIPVDLLDQFVTGPMTAESVDAVMRKFKKAILERALGAEMTHHFGYEPGADKPTGSSNHRNGSSGKTVLTDDGPLLIEWYRARGEIEMLFDILKMPVASKRCSCPGWPVCSVLWPCSWSWLGAWHT